MSVSRSAVCASALIVILLFVGRDAAYAAPPPDPVLDAAGITIAGSGVDVQFGHIELNHPIEANFTAQVNTTQMKVSTNWFELNASLLAPTVILSWAYNYTYKFATPWINTTSPVGFGAKYSANYLVNTSTISTGLKFYEVSGTYITASPHYFSSNSSLRFLTNGNPVTINVFAGTNGKPTVVKANGATVTENAGWTWDGTNQIVHITNVGTRFAIGWASVSPATEQVTVSMANGAPTQTITVTGTGCSVGSFSADGAQHTFTCTASTSLTLSPPSNTTSLFVFTTSGNHGTVSYTTTTAGGTDTKSYTLNELASESFQYAVSGGGSPSAPTISFTQNNVATTFTLKLTPTTKLLDFASAWSVSPNPLTGSGSTERWFASSGLSGTASAGGSQTTTFVHQYLLTMSVNPSNCGSTAPAVGTVFENAGATVGGISATPVAGCTFSSWTGTGSGSFTGSSNPTTITMNGAITEEAGFTGAPTTPSSCTLAQSIVSTGSNSFGLLASLFFVMAGGTVVVGIMMFGSRDASNVMPLVFMVFLLGTVVIAVSLIFGAASVANNSTLNSFGCPSPP